MGKNTIEETVMYILGQCEERGVISGKSGKRHACLLQKIIAKISTIMATVDLRGFFVRGAMRN